MHRSGTSMLARILDQAGIFMGYDLTDDHESWYFQRVNTAWMNAENFSWDRPGEPVQANTKLFNHFSFLRHYVRLSKLPLKPLTFLSANSWGWKDPRNTFTVMHWKKIFPEAKIIHIYRNGMDVAISLYKRNLNLDFTNKWHSQRLENKLEGIKLWEEYAAKAFEYDHKIPNQIFHFSFEKLLAQDAETILRLELVVNCKLESLIKKMADRERTARFNAEEHQDLKAFAQQSEWMHKLNYL